MEEDGELFMCMLLLNSLQLKNSFHVRRWHQKFNNFLTRHSDFLQYFAYVIWSVKCICIMLYVVSCFRFFLVSLINFLMSVGSVMMVSFSFLVLIICPFFLAVWLEVYHLKKKNHPLPKAQALAFIDFFWFKFSWFSLFNPPTACFRFILPFFIYFLNVDAQIIDLIFFFSDVII